MGEPTVVVKYLTDASLRPPVPVMAASGLLGLLTVVFVALAVFLFSAGPAVLLAPLVAATLTGFLAVGIWRGARGANLATLFFSALATYAGISSLVHGNHGLFPMLAPIAVLVSGALLGLLLGHGETRRHFWS